MSFGALVGAHSRFFGGGGKLGWVCRFCCWEVEFPFPFSPKIRSSPVSSFPSSWCSSPRLADSSCWSSSSSLSSSSVSLSSLLLCRFWWLGFVFLVNVTWAVSKIFPVSMFSTRYPISVFPNIRPSQDLLPIFPYWFVGLRMKHFSPNGWIRLRFTCLPLILNSGIVFLRAAVGLRFLRYAAWCHDSLIRSCSFIYSSKSDAAIIALDISPKVRFFLSASPFCCGVPAVDVVDLIPFSS